MMSARTPVFRAFPRVGVPPHYGSWEIYSRRVKLMMRAGAIDVSDDPRFAELMRQCPYSPRIFNNLAKDRNHFSATGG